MIAPSLEADSLYPLVIDLHGASGGEGDAHMHTDCYVEPFFEGMDVFILSPNGSIYSWPSLRNQEMVINLLVLALAQWPIDPARVVVTGYSNGGNGAWYFGETQPVLISAAIPMASSYSTTASDGSTRVMPIPMYVIHGENDELFPLAQTQEWVNATIAVGSDVTFSVVPGLGHYEPCSYMPYMQDAVIWLQEEVWN